VKPPGSWELAGSIKAPANLDHWDAFIEFVDQQADLYLHKKKRYGLKLASEEILSNIVRYSKPVSTTETPDSVALELKFYTCQQFAAERPSVACILVIQDDGIAFDPGFESPCQVDTTVPIDSRRIGGLGLFLVKQSLDQVQYARVDRFNQYTLVMFDEPDHDLSPSVHPSDGASHASDQPQSSR
jgi:serine/threonine-protein kinase RsbW